MMQKKYLMVSLLAAAALLTGCSETSSTSSTVSDAGSNSGAVANAAPEETGSNPTPSPTRTDGLINPSEDKSVEMPAKTFEDAAVDVVKVPQSVLDSEGYVPIPIPETSGSVVETEDDVTMVFNDSFETVALHQWVTDLEAQGWKVSAMDKVDNETTYNMVLMKPDRAIAIYANNTPQTTNTVISFTK